MRAHEVIDATLAEWRAVAPKDVAAGTFQLLDQEEITRLALRGYTEEWREALRGKRYASVQVTRPDGGVERVYKQVELFSAEELAALITYHRSRAIYHAHTARRLAQQAWDQHGLNVCLPGLEDTPEMPAVEADPPQPPAVMAPPAPVVPALPPARGQRGARPPKKPAVTRTATQEKRATRSQQVAL